MALFLLWKRIISKVVKCYLYQQITYVYSWVNSCCWEPCIQNHFPDPVLPEVQMLTLPLSPTPSLLSAYVWLLHPSHSIHASSVLPHTFTTIAWKNMWESKWSNWALESCNRHADHNIYVYVCIYACVYYIGTHVCIYSSVF